MQVTKRDGTREPVRFDKITQRLAYLRELSPCLERVDVTRVAASVCSSVRDGIDTTVITDNMAGAMMRLGHVDLVVVGADRIAANGDVANKIGTYSVAVLAREHGIPFYVAAPTSTIDLATPDGSRIPIEERNAREVTHVGPTRLAPEGAKIRNPAFDVTPAKYVTAIVTERGIARPPYDESLAAIMGQAPAVEAV